MSTEDTETGAPNLDAMPRAELIEWARKHAYAPVVMARELFPARPTLYVTATRMLITYAQTKQAAMGLREAGAISHALELEANCEWLYNRLPKYARW